MKKNPVWLCVIFALAGGIFAGWVDFNNDEVQATVLVILVVTFIAGFIMPKKAWLWAIIVAFCLPGVYLFARSLGYQPVSPPSPGWYASLLAIIPALIGAYSGTVGRVILNNAFTLSSPHNGK
jgi:MFS-type transporter involved in bile tolerance (Atg22 family)